ncbi:MAG: hypothetical protein NT157_01480 [Candidatus Micrarchaeota archaeon]|nr:hypothetical protein [Candidatus Micrarchaeota archaeon]
MAVTVRTNSESLTPIDLKVAELRMLTRCKIGDRYADNCILMAARSLGADEIGPVFGRLGRHEKDRLIPLLTAEQRTALRGGNGKNGGGRTPMTEGAFTR